MKNLIFFLIPLFVYAKGYYVQEPIVNMYYLAKKNTDVVSQLIYGEKVKIIKKMLGFYQIESEDGYQGWIVSNTVLEKEKEKGIFYPIKNLVAHVYRLENTRLYPPILTLAYGSMIKVLDTKPKRWIPVELVDGKKAFIQRGDIEFNPKILSIDEVCDFSKKFLGIPYIWGGRSSFGYDSSGFVQMLYKHLGVNLPRDAHLQAKSSLLVSIEKEKLKPGDLIFFGKPKIFHNGLYLGKDTFIHATVAEGGPKIALCKLSTFSIKYSCARRPNTSSQK